MFINKRTNNCTYIQIYIPQFINIDEKVRRRESKRDRGGGGVARNVSNASAQVLPLKSCFKTTTVSISSQKEPGLDFNDFFPTERIQ